MLNAEQIGFFEHQGYLVVPEILDEADLVPVKAEYEEVLARAAGELFAAGSISSTFGELEFADRYVAMLSEFPGLYRYLNISLPLSNDPLSAEDCRMHAGPAVFDLLCNDKVLDVVESLIGGEIRSNPVQHIRLKPPQSDLPEEVAGYSNIGATTWHQDHGAVMDEAEDTDMVTVWVAVTDAAVEHGCLVVSPATHAARQLTLHCPGLNVDVAAENYIPQAMRHGKPVVALPVAAGSLVLLNKYVEHAALANTSEQLRWSFDLRYQPADQPTGRPAFPSFVARSRDNPRSVMTDWRQYAAQWEETRRTMLGPGFGFPVFEESRWLVNAGHPAC
ncbi:MAG: phytanoyl-CoA dioxygenase [Acidimicrobiia bacterium]|nr:phytanoyl-CoA dioxygenase [Acidimicrobiia bacterium]